MEPNEGNGGGGGAEGENKPSQLDLLASMLAAMRADQAQQAQQLAQQLAQLAQQQAQRQEQQAQQLMDTLQSNLSSLRSDARDYTDRSCDSVRDELQTVKDELQTVKGVLEKDLKTLRDEVRETRRDAIWREPESAGAVGREQGVLGWPDVECCGRPGSAASAPCVAMGGGLGLLGGADQWRAPGALAAPRVSVDRTAPPFPPSPPHSPTASARRFSLSPPDTPPRRSSPRCKPRKPAEYDGRVAWESYAAQFDLLAAAQGWDEAEKALQLATALRGPAIEVLGHLPSTHRASFPAVAEALRRRFGHRHQAEVYRAQLKKRTRQRGESLSQLAHDIEALVRRAYPTAGEEMVTVLARDAFLDALMDHQLQIYVRQAHPADVQVALARAMEFEAFMQTASSVSVFARPRNDVRGRKAHVKRKVTSRETSPGGFGGRCWRCGEKGHVRARCPRERRTRSLDRPDRVAFQPCCKDCGGAGHRSSACPNPKDIVAAGNDYRLEVGAASQPATTPVPRLV